MAATGAAQSKQRVSRLIALVSNEEAVIIAAKADAAGLSVSAFLRERALDEENADKFDDLLDRMESDLDTATAALNEALTRMAANG